VRQVCTVGYFRSQLQNKVMPDYTITHQKVQLSPAIYHLVYQNRQLKDLKMIQFHRDHAQGSSDEHERGLQIVSCEKPIWWLLSMASGIVSYCRYQQFELWISVMDIICWSWYWQLVLLQLRNSDIDNWNCCTLCCTLLLATIGIVDITNTNCRYQQLVLLRSCITDIDNWNCRYQ